MGRLPLSASKRRQRLGLAILSCLLGGLLASQLIAVYLAGTWMARVPAGMNNPVFDARVEAGVRRLLSEEQRRTWSTEPVRGSGLSSTGVEIYNVQFGTPEDGVFIARIEAGWPVVSARTWVARTPLKTGDWNGGWQLGEPILGLARNSVLPWAPRWTGLLVNTLLYGAMLWLVFCAPFELRRRLRRRSGSCPVCGYDLRGSREACPECGRMIAGRSGEHSS